MWNLLWLGEALLYNACLKGWFTIRLIGLHCVLMLRHIVNWRIGTTTVITARRKWYTISVSDKQTNCAIYI